MAGKSVCTRCGARHTSEEGCDPRIGTTIDGKYELTRVLGEGGMGKVYAAKNLRVGRRAALKFLLPQFAVDKDMLRRFEKEAQLAGSLEHENLAAVTDFGRAPDGAYFLVMEYLEGEDCDELLRKSGWLPIHRTIDIILQVCRGLDSAHQRGIVHRDLKPANLFLCRRADGSDLVKILDFGIAKLRVGAGESGTTTQGQTTGPIGTAYYMSPEQARGEKEIDARSDVYAVGVIMYELLSGRRPHEGDSLLQIIHRILSAKPQPLSEARPELPEEVVAIVEKAMAFAPADRFPSIEALGEALRPLAGRPAEPIRSSTLPAPPPVTGPQPRAAVPAAGSPISDTPGASPMASTLTPAGAVAAPEPPAPTTHAPINTTPVVPMTSTPRAGIFIGLGALLVVGGAGFFAMRGSPRPTAEPLVPEASASASAPVPTSASASASTSAAATVSAIASSTASASASASSPARVVRAPALPPPAKPVPAAAPAPNCNPNYTLDSNGDKHFKPECFKK